MQYAAWAELIIIQMVMPNVSFFGHLCGILAGVPHQSSIDHPPTPLPAMDARDQADPRAS